MRRLERALAGVFLAGTTATPANSLAIVGATVVDGSAVLADGIVVVAKGRIDAVGPRAQVRLPKGVPLQDGRGLYVIPGPPWSEAAVGTLRAKVRAGSPLREALLAALRERRARLAPGEPADLVVLDKDPLADPSNLRAVVRALREGRELTVDERRAAER